MMAEGYHRNRNPLPSQTRKNVLSFVTTFCEMNGYSPTIQEIRDGVGLKSNGAVQHQIDLLIFDGLLNHIPNRIRSIVPATL